MAKGKINKVVGYSLGGALAILIAEKLRNVEVITFACPNIGTKTWAGRYPHSLTEYYVSPDLIIKLPPYFTKPKAEVIKIPGCINFIYNHYKVLEEGSLIKDV